ncbi:Trifunctional nucleotide phosphoesterase protein YfkN [Bacteroides pyogenes]|nr:Trifunctional nucleotide phosphoesterase protein YfkN [Bacteroides pyogenes]MBR8723841.1 Trifunctional nucleotide phosphoesterase protein YfkN [Bacteroides pyogenes]MBR8737292.1 Trifunctional nucleotide phosphoesterase protein YfkN [Bacteroides pyogenes]MBR8752965.1 Trifunctional nucleotide phosphoesterase protein YfkN [Bacteroides pyogenes]MBR8785856.1 Trifunctional nucleotide phosphoesterase protein YfkN [Bacteroides pyogenes]
MYMKKLHTLLIVCFVWGFGFSASAQKTKQLIILQTSDVHSRIEPINQKGDKNYKEGGFVRRATFLNRFRKENEHVLLFDCGDFSQGTPYYNIYKGEVEVKLMNEMDYDACTIGNHEFDFGLENMARLFKMAAFPIVCSNYDLENTPLRGLVKPYIILERFGLRIGVFGLGAKPDGLIQADKCEGVVYKDPVQVSNETAALLKSEGCDVVVCLSHLGIQTDERLIADTRNIDVVLGGHSHTFMKAPKTYLNADGKEVRLMHTGKNGVRVGRLDLTLTRK